MKITDRNKLSKILKSTILILTIISKKGNIFLALKIIFFLFFIKEDKYFSFMSVILRFILKLKLRLLQSINVKC